MFILTSLCRPVLDLVDLLCHHILTAMIFNRNLEAFIQFKDKLVSLRYQDPGPLMLLAKIIIPVDHGRDTTE